MPAFERRYDIDWLRVIAIGLLLVYHVAIAFQPWGVMIGFIANPKPWAALWIPMSMINVWRIPLLFFVSGMGLYFAMGQRNLLQLMVERSRRILLPYIFGMFAIVPIHLLIWQYHYNLELLYTWYPGHLWFLGNIFVYVILLAPIFYLFRQNASSTVIKRVKSFFGHPVSLLLVTVFLVAEALIINPMPYELYAITWHGFFLGLLAFFFGYCFVLAGSGFEQMIQSWKWVFLILALSLFSLRVFYFGTETLLFLIPIESLAWILGLLAIGSKYFNHTSKLLTYLSEAAYPVYIVHMIFIFLGAFLIFPLDLPVQLQFILLLTFTIVGCFAAYEGIRRIETLRMLFGLKKKAPSPRQPVRIKSNF